MTAPTSFNLPEKVTLTLTGNTLAVLLDLLSQAPYRVAAPIFNEVTAQLTPTAPTEAPAE